ncbi:MAG: prepilin-type N-terminal cleavage/methylation domain-containing protein [Deltaproteobacteria bacterium]|jgi:Tfp pilus assembly protein FimT|nr:prepilin-type N-terminal cleavage/methylation domain-containing protein [Deltaproteobacteria bacterium]
MKDEVLLNRLALKSQAGFSLMELLTIIIIMGVLVAISYPLMSSRAPDLASKSGARELETLLKKARIRAANQNRPLRVVINCARQGGVDQCFLDLQSAVVKDAGVTDWARIPGDHQLLDHALSIVKNKTSDQHDGKLSIQDIYWIIFLPSGRVFSDPKPLELFLYHSSQKQELKKGWRLTVDKETGRVENSRAEFRTP